MIVIDVSKMMMKSKSVVIILRNRFAVLLYDYKSKRQKNYARKKKKMKHRRNKVALNYHTFVKENMCIKFTFLIINEYAVLV